LRSKLNDGQNNSYSGNYFGDEFVNLVDLGLKMLMPTTKKLSTKEILKGVGF
jgi:hypothetical protein